MRSVSAIELAYRVALRFDNGTWIALIAPAERESIVVSQVRSALEEAIDTEVEVIDASGGVRSLTTQLHNASDKVVVIRSLNRWRDEKWRELDGIRTRLARSLTTILICSEVSAERLESTAPNLASWLGGNIWTWNSQTASLSTEEIERRLGALRRWYGKTNEEIIALAESGDLALGPEHIEWLVLLGRGDLIA